MSEEQQKGSQKEGVSLTRVTDVLRIARFFRPRRGMPRTARRRIYQMIAESGALLEGSPEAVARIREEEGEEG